MSDVGKIPGEKGPRPSEDKKSKRKASSEAFREMMKVGKVREADPDEQKKRKNQAEAEEELAAQQAGPAPHQGLEPKAPPPFFSEEGTQPQVGEMGSKPPPSLPPSKPPENPQDTQRPTPTYRKKKKRKISHEKGVPPPTKKAKGTKRKLGKKLHTPQLHPTKPPDAEKKSEKIKGHFPKTREETFVEAPKKKETQLPQAIEGIAQQPLPQGAWEATREIEKKEQPTTTPAAALETGIQSPLVQTGTVPIQPETLPPLAAPFAHLPPQIARIFERMVGVMTVMNLSGISETTITLDNPQYAKSVFYGAQIVITEFSTAPKEFNIELKGNQQAVNLMMANTEELVAAFQAGRYNFKVNRIDLSQQGSTAEIRRKQAQRVKRKKTGGR